MRPHLLLAFLFVSICTSTTYSGSFSIWGVYNTHGPYTFSGSAGADTADLQLSFNDYNSVTPLLMFVKRNNTPPNLSELDLDSYKHKNTNYSLAYDLENANLGKTQVVNVNGLSAGSKLFIFVVNFYTTASTSYTVNVTERAGFNQGYCSPGNPLSSNSIYCAYCVDSSTGGSFCDITSTVLPISGSVYGPVLPAWNDTKDNYVTVTIPASSSIINLYYATSVKNVAVAIQFQYYPNEVAGIINYASGGLKLINQSNTQFSVPINSGGTNNVSVTFINLGPTPASLNIWYTVQTSVNLLVIVLIALGGILLVGVIVVVVCIIRRVRSPQPQAMSGIFVRVNSMRIHSANDLSMQQIQTYFPAVLCVNVIKQEQPSLNNLAAEKEANADRDCVICLSSIVSTDMIKVAYCRHVFHAQCLNRWFQKQRSCPYCRQEYNRTSTLEHYQTLLNSSHKHTLAGIELAKEILLSRHKSHAVIEQFKS